MSEEVKRKDCGCRDDDHDSCPQCEGWSQEELDRTKTITSAEIAEALERGGHDGLDRLYCVHLNPAYNVRFVEDGGKTIIILEPKTVQTDTAKDRDDAINELRAAIMDESTRRPYLRDLLAGSGLTRVVQMMLALHGCPLDQVRDEAYKLMSNAATHLYVDGVALDVPDAMSVLYTALSTPGISSGPFQSAESFNKAFAMADSQRMAAIKAQRKADDERLKKMREYNDSLTNRQFLRKKARQGSKSKRGKR
jgi:hypothetical protein